MTWERLANHRLSRLAAGAIGGGLVAASFPGLNFWPGALAGIALLYLALWQAGAYWAYLTTALFGLAMYLPTFVWANYSAGLVPWLALSCAACLILGVLGIAWSFVQRLRWLVPSSPIGVLAFALLWAGTEQLRQVFPFGGFPWGSLGFTQVESPLLKLAALGGNLALTFSVSVLGGLLALILVWLSDTRFASASVGLICVVALACAPMLLATPGARVEHGELRLAAVQGNVSVTSDNLFAERREVLDNHVRQTEALAAANRGKLDVVLWPENGTDIDPDVDIDAWRSIDRAARAVDAPILVGSMKYLKKGRLNQSIYWLPGTGPDPKQRRYNKQKPAPFGERIPARGLFRHLSSKVDLIATDVLAGKASGIFTVTRGSGGDARLGTVICFEVAVDDVVAKTVRNGAQIIVVQTNNASFGRSQESAQQLAMSRIRAVEHGRSVVQVSTTGASALIGPDGRVLQRTGLFTSSALVGSLPLRDSLTIASRAERWLGTVTLIAAALLSVGGAVAAGYFAPARVRRSSERAR